MSFLSDDRLKANLLKVLTATPDLKDRVLCILSSPTLNNPYLDAENYLPSSSSHPSLRSVSPIAFPQQPNPKLPKTSYTMNGANDPEREQALKQYTNKLLESREWEAKLKALRLDIKGLQKDFDTTEENIKALQSVGQIIGEVLKQLDEERCTHGLILV